MAVHAASQVGFGSNSDVYHRARFAFISIPNTLFSHFSGCVCGFLTLFRPSYPEKSVLAALEISKVDFQSPKCLILGLLPLFFNENIYNICGVLSAGQAGCLN